MILGIDEVGRGPWAGPLVVGAVVLGGAKIVGLTDSKKLSKKRREQLNVQILEQASGVGLGWVSAVELDEIGLSAALRLATRRAIEQINVTYHEIIIDGTANLLKGTTLEQYVTTMKKADLLVPSVSAASIVAKVARDNYMAEQADVYPGYGFKQHVGYGTAAHRAAIDKLGVTLLHRLSFAPLTKYSTLSVAPSIHKQTQKRRNISSKLPLASAELATPRQSSKRKGNFAKIFGLSHIASESKEPLPAPNTRSVGNMSETAAAQELVRRGHVIIERNWKTKFCEIDIVSEKDGMLYFTEVKHRKNERAGGGLAAITKTKLRQMKFAAELYASNYPSKDICLSAIATTGDTAEVSDYVEAIDS